MSESPPIRDTLLIKCKAAIEDLHCEVDRLSEENHELKQKLLRQQTLSEDLKYQMEHQQHRQIQLTQQLEDALNSIQEKEQLESEWEQEIEKVSRRIEQLQQSKEQSLASAQEDYQHQLDELQRYHEGEMSKMKQMLDEQKRTNQQYQRSLQDEKDQLDRRNMKLNDLQQQWNQEKEQIRLDALNEVEKLQRMANALQSDIDKARQDKERIRKELFECREDVLQKEYQIQEAKVEYQHQLDALQQHNYDELKKLQSIIDDQGELINSYERCRVRDIPRVVEREKAEVEHRHQKIVEIQNQANRDKEGVRADALNEVEKLQRVANSLQQDIDRARVEMVRLRNEVNECRDLLIQKDYELRDSHDHYHKKIEEIQQSNYIELAKLQHIIDGQTDLIRFYERMVEKEKPVVPRRQEAYETLEKSFSSSSQINKGMNDSLPERERKPVQKPQQASSKQKKEKEFLNKFQSVINRMEHKLETMQGELNLNPTKHKHFS